MLIVQVSVSSLLIIKQTPNVIIQDLNGTDIFKYAGFMQVKCVRRNKEVNKEAVQQTAGLLALNTNIHSAMQCLMSI